jgi:TolB-like protein/Tfp pilus assembly protein PilF
MTEEEKKPPSDSTGSPQTGPAAFWQELRRRKVVRVAMVYAVVGWMVMQVGATVFPNLGIPQWVLSGLILLVILGFPIAIVLAWAFDLTPDGIKSTQPGSPSSEGEKTSGDSPRTSSLKPIVLAATIPTLIFGALALFFFFRSSPPVSPDVSGGGSPELVEFDKSIAVLPFANRSASEDDAFFTDGIHDDLLTHISRIHDIKTISRTSVMGYRGTTKSMPTIGQELGVAFILEGGVQRAGKQIRINVQLIDAERDEHIWAEIYTRSMTAENIFEIQTEIATTITKALQAVLSPEQQEELAKLPTKNLAALEAYFKGKEAMDPLTANGLVNAIRFYDEALELDPEFAEAHAYKALALIQRVQMRITAREPTIVLAELHAQRALELNPKLSVAHHAMAEISLLRRDNDEAGKSFQRAIDLDPANTLAAIRYSQFVSDVVGDAAAAAAILQRSLEYDPNGSFTKVGAAIQAAQAGRIHEARELFKAAAAEDPTNPTTLTALGNFYDEYESRFDEAIIALRKALVLDPLNPDIAYTLVNSYAVLGELDKAVYWQERTNQASLTYQRTHPRISSKDSEVRIQEALDRFENYQPGKTNRGSTDHWMLLKHDIANGQPEKSLARYQLVYPELFVEDPVVTGETMYKAKDAAWALIASGFREQGLKLIDRALAVVESMEAKIKPLLARALMYAVAGREPEAIAAIKDFFNGGGSPTRILGQDEFNSLRDNPEFQAIEASMKAELQRQRERIDAMEAAGELAPIPPLPKKPEQKP